MTRIPPRRAGPASLWPLALALAVGGCATPTGNGQFPSLLPRPDEAGSFAEPAATPVEAAVPDPALDATIAKARATLAQTGSAFATKAQAAERAATAAKGDAIGGERWIAAQAALAELDATRSATSSIVTELDDLAFARATDLKPAYPALEALRRDAQAAAEAQGVRIAGIEARLPGTEAKAP